MKKNIVVKAWLTKPKGKALEKTVKLNLQELIQKLEGYEFECQGGYLKGCKDWINLKKEVSKL